MKFLLLAGALLINAIKADSICGPNARFMVAIVCGDGSKTLYNAPNSLKDRSQFCQNPNDKWSKAKCNNKGGFVSVDIEHSGCYLNSLGTDSGIPVPDYSLINPGFEFSDLTGWSTSGPTAATVVCGDGTAPEGNCYASITTVGTGPGSEVNSLTMADLIIPNYGGCNTYNYGLSFWYRFDAEDYLPYNDYLLVELKDSTNSVVFTKYVDVSNVGDYGDSGWQYQNVFLGSPPVGSALHLSISASTSNVGDSILNSYSYIDGVNVFKI